MSNAEVAFLAAGQQAKTAEPKPKGRPALRECPACGGRIKVVNGRLADHGTHRMTKTGIRGGAKRCDGSRLHIPTAKEN